MPTTGTTPIGCGGTHDLLHPAVLLTFAHRGVGVLVLGAHLLDRGLAAQVAGATGNIVYQDAVMRMRDEMMGDLVENDGLTRGPALPHESLEWQGNHSLGVVRPARAGTLAHADGSEAGPASDDADEAEHCVDVALHGVDVGESSLLRDLQG